MGRYRWTGVGSFEDRANDRSIEPGETVEINDHIANGWSEFVEVEDSEDEPEPDGSDESGDTYSESELEDMEWSELREMASDYDGDEVNGKSSKEDVVEFFTGREK